MNRRQGFVAEGTRIVPTPLMHRTPEARASVSHRASCVQVREGALATIRQLPFVAAASRGPCHANPTSGSTTSTLTVRT